MVQKICCTGLAACAFLLICSPVEILAQDAPKPASKSSPIDEGGTPADQKLFHEVMDRLMQTGQVRDNYPKDLSWPPFAYIQPHSAKEFNAYAAAFGKKDAKDKIPARVIITEGFMNNVIKGDVNVLAAIMGHELAHLIKKHAGNYQKDDLKFRAFSRNQEIEADLEGVKIAVAANYPYQSGVRAFYRAWLEFGSYSNFEGLTATHPSFIERLEILDRNKAHIWKAMAAFQNGHFFLHAEQYKTAESCFLAVVKEFPECAEAWANIGYARLMLYCDGLDEKDLKAFGISQFVAGCFYARPQGIAVGRNADEKEWREAVSALEKALKLDPHLVLARGNLGLAYLVHPNGKKVGPAIEQFSRALDQKDNGLDGLNKAAFLINYGVAKQAEGKLLSAGLTYQLARAALPKARFDRNSDMTSNQLAQALIYNEAQLAAAKGDDKGKEKAFFEFEFYLEIAPSSSTWWTLALEQYEKLGKELKHKTMSQSEFAKLGRRAQPRVQASVEITPGNNIILSDGMDKALKTLGRESMEGIPITPAIKKIKRYCEACPGVDILADQKVLAIFLTSDKSPALFVQNMGLGAQKKKVSVGMTSTDFHEAMKGYFSERRYVDNPTIEYQFFPDMGLGVRFAENQVVRELVLAQIPRRWDRGDRD